jgi:GMP synthase-like glutamine amidotransferase
MVAIIKNVKEEGPGSIEDFLKENSIPFKIFEAELGEFPANLEEYKYLIVLGGPMGVYEMDLYPNLKRVAKIIEEALERGLKVLGVCLGAQLLAHVLGGRVYKGPRPEIGWLDIELTDAGKVDQAMRALAKHPKTEEISTRFKVFHWHGDTFDLPSGAIHLARSDLYQNQAFNYEDRVYALQFHVEVTEDLLSTWFENSPLKKRVLSEFQTLKSEYLERAKNFYHALFL